MTNIFQDLGQKVISYIYQGKIMDEYEELGAKRRNELQELFDYYEGRQRRPLKKGMTDRDFNVLANLTGVIINRSVSMLVGAGVDFNLPGTVERVVGGKTEKINPAQEYINLVYDLNKGDIFLHDLVQFGSIYGTAFIKIIPNGKGAYPRLVALNPYNVIIETAPDDIDNVIAYVVRWNDGDTAWREVTKIDNGVWHIITQKANKETKGQWEDQSDVLFEYPFSPITHVKNLPRAGRVYGMSDIEGVIELQDKYNASQSDINAILGNNAFPLRYTSGGKLPKIKLSDGSEAIDMSPSKIIESANENFKMNTVEMQSDLSSSRSFVKDIRSDIFDISSTVDAETLRQNASQITNFGLRVMYKDELAKNATKQMLYGELLKDANSRLLEIGNLPNDPGEVVWGDPLPVNEIEEINALKSDYDMGIVSLETVSQIRNYDFADEQDKRAKEKTNSDSLGGDLLRSFIAGNNV